MKRTKRHIKELSDDEDSTLRLEKFRHLSKKKSFEIRGLNVIRKNLVMMRIQLACRNLFLDVCNQAYSHVLQGCITTLGH